LAGAFVGLADDSSTAFLNPAGLVTLPKTELGGAVLSGQSGTVGGADRLNSRTGLGYVAGAGRFGERFAVGGYLVQPRAGRTDLAAVLLPDGSTDAGYLDATIIEGGVGIAYKVSDRVNVGARITGTHLKLEGLYSRTSAAQVVDLQSGTAAGHTRLTASMGVLYQSGIERKFRVGLIASPGASYTAERTATGSAGVVDLGSQYEIRQPALFAGGASYQVTPEILLTSQLDYVRYSEIKAFVRPGAVQEDAYGADDAVEPRFGIELSRHFGNVSLQLRGGIHSQGGGALTYAGADPVERATFPGCPRQLLGAIGASLATPAGLRVDVAATFGGDRTELLAGARIRF
jgi:long-subunit fatty acid transport protein